MTDKRVFSESPKNVLHLQNGSAASGRARQRPGLAAPTGGAGVLYTPTGTGSPLSALK